MSKTKKISSSRVAPFGMLTLALGLVLGTSSTNAFTSGPVVEVGPNLKQSILNQINTLKSQISAKLAQAQAYSEYAKTLRRWNDTLTNWERKLAKYEQLIANGGFNRNIPIEHIDPRFNVDEQCGPGAGLSLSGLATMLSSKFTGATNIAEKRREICTAIQLLSNKKHNDTVDMMMQVLPRMQGYLNEIAGIRSLLNTEGSLAESTNNSLQSANSIELEFQQWERGNELIDQYIVALQRQQQVLTSNALNGERTTSKLLAGTLIQAGTIGLALKPESKKTDKK